MNTEQPRISAQPSANHFRVLIVGAGSGGVSVAARLRRAMPAAAIGIVDPAEKHHYQPLWTLVGGGVVPKEASERPQASVIPAGVTWVREAVAELDPGSDAVVTTTGGRITYDFLVLAPGIQVDWKKVSGLAENVGREAICSNYAYDTVDSTWSCIRNFQGGRAIFTHPNTPIKCGGAPQKIMYLAADYWRKNPPPHPYEIVFCMGPAKIFAVEKYARTLLRVVERYGIEVRYQQDLSEIDAVRRLATFRKCDSGETSVLDYAMLHVTPPMSAPDFLKGSPLANADGWLDVNKETLRHPRFPNVFALGDAAALPTSKTGAAIRKQAPILVANLMAVAGGGQPVARYDGYTSCPLVTGYGKLVMAEFDYDLNPQETFPFDQGKERLSMYLLKKHVLPVFYWRGMLRGRA